ncbi:MBL fold metallo-hydrolase [Enorma massiliensis]|uniref:MBL fold metallo-hydrolase n=1 Tax=Enorma massiliensis TaxID=1472761 RepID=UPI00031EDA25|nr:MBL fold metallo-hydrolase [Enorma massiliensis]
MTSLENVRVFTQSAIRIQSKDGVVIYLDPFSLTDAEAAHDADYVFITHAHFDHFSPEDIARVAGDHTELVAPASMGAEVARVADEIGATAVHLLQAGGRLELPGVAVEAVPAYNVEPERLGMHPQTHGWLGYVLTVDGVRYYAAGDTDQNPDNEQVACDVALVPIGGTYTCDPHQAAAFVNALHPKTVVPIHYGSIVGVPENFDEFASEVAAGIEVVRKVER